jgi:linoleoyl-CoA desaturase
MTIPVPVKLNEHEIEEFGRELDEIYEETIASLGTKDERYIKRLISTQRTMALVSRLVIFASLAFLPSWWQHSMASWSIFYLVIGLGILMLASAKVLENMEIAHNVLHGQWDWMRDPQINSTVWEWDHVTPADQWKNTHNVVHHTWTNVLRKDHDVGYGLLRVTDQQKWGPRYLLQPFYNVLLCVFFEWGIGIQEMNWKILFKGTDEQRAHYSFILKRFRQKAFRQVMKDYVLWPLLSGPFFFYVMLANVTANILRNIWTNIIIFCGHFPDDVYVFNKEDIEGETRAYWYVRQLLGSANIKGGTLFSIMSGNLNHQIEHHLFPDLPSNRYPQVAPRVKALCARFGLPYNSDSLWRQYGTTTWKIWRLAFPGGKTSPNTI